MIEEGKKAPAFSLKDADNKEHALKDYMGKWIVLYFYPKDDTPGCTTEACEFTSLFDEFAGMDAVILGVSPDTPEKHVAFRAKHALKVTLLSDPDKKVLEKYGAFGPKKSSGKETVGVIRSTFLIDPKGNLAHAFRNVKANGHAEKVKAKRAELQ